MGEQVDASPQKAPKLPMMPSAPAKPNWAGTWWVPARLGFAGAEGIIGSFGTFCGEANTCPPLGQ